MKEAVPEYTVNIQANGSLKLFQDQPSEEIALATPQPPEQLTKREQRQLRATLYRLIRRSRGEIHRRQGR